MKRFAALLERRSSWIALALCAATLAAFAGMAQLEFEDSYRRIFRSSDAGYLRLEEIASQFGAGENDCVVLVEADDVLERGVLRALREAHTALDGMPGIEAVVSIHSARGRRRVGRYWLPVLPGEGDDVSEERLVAAREELRRHPLVIDRLLSRDGEATLLVVRLDAERQAIEDVNASLEEIHGVLREAVAGTGAKFGLTGLPVIRSETIGVLKHEHAVISFAGSLLASGASWLLLRRFGHVVIVVTPAMLGIVWTLGLMGWAGQPLGMINAVLPALLMVIGLTDAMHLLFHFRREAAGDARRAAFGSVAELGRACLLTSITTCIGFGSLMACRDETIATFGLWAALGVVLTFLAVVTAFPLLAVSRLGRTSPHSAEFSSFRGSAFERLAQLVTARPGSVVVGSLVVCLASAAAAAQLKPDYSFTEHMADSEPPRNVLLKCERRFGGVPLLQVAVSWPEEQSLRVAEMLEVLAATHAAIERNPMASHPTSFLTLLESLPNVDGDLRTALPETRHVPEEALSRFVRPEVRQAVVIAATPDAGAAALERPLAELKSELRQIEAAHNGFSLALTGYMPVAAERANSMIWDLVRSLGLATVIIFLVIAVAFRSLSFGLISVIPNGLPLLATAALMAVMGEPLQYVTVLAFSICLGVAVDDTIHFLSRYHQERERTVDSREAVRRTLAAIAPVLVVTTVLMVIGFGAAYWGSMLTVQSFAVFSCAALLLALASDVIVLPALLLVLPRRSSSQGGNHAEAASTPP